MKYDIPQCIGARLRRLSRIADAYYRKCLVDFNITENQMTILFVLSKMGKIEQGKIGEILFLERSTVSRNIKLLEKQKLVSRTIDYRPEIELTTEGKELVKVLLPKWEEVMDELAGKIGQAGFDDIKDLENKLI